MAHETTPLGTISPVHWDSADLWTEEVDDSLASIKAGWAQFEGRFPSLSGRKMMGLASDAPGSGGTYRFASIVKPDDPERIPGLHREMVEFGAYLRHRIKSEPPALYDLIGPAFGYLFDHHGERIDWTRPTIEFHHSRDMVDCLVPIVSA